MSAQDRSAASRRRWFGIDGRTYKAIKRNARSMKPKEYAWLRAQTFQPPIRQALIFEYERIHGAAS